MEGEKNITAVRQPTFNFSSLLAKGKLQVHKFIGSLIYIKYKIKLSEKIAFISKDMNIMPYVKYVVLSSLLPNDSNIESLSICWRNICTRYLFHLHIGLLFTYNWNLLQNKRNFFMNMIISKPFIKTIIQFDLQWVEKSHGAFTYLIYIMNWMNS